MLDGSVGECVNVSGAGSVPEGELGGAASADQEAPHGSSHLVGDHDDRFVRRPYWAMIVDVHRVGAVIALLSFFGIVYARTLNSGGMFRWDEAEYASIGRSVLRGDGFAISGKPNPLRPPVLPLAGAASMRLAGSTADEVVKRPTLGFSLLALLVVYACAATVYGWETGLAAASLLGVSPGFWISTPLFMTEIPFMACFCGAIVAFHLGLYRDSRFFVLAWACWGLAFLTRYTAVVFAPITVVLIALSLLDGDVRVRQRLFSRAFLLAPIAALILVVPWLVRQQLTFGDALVGMKQASMQLQLFLPDQAMPWYFYPVRLLPMLSPGVAVLAIAGTAWALSQRDRLAIHCLATVALIIAWFSFYRFKEDRQITAVLPLLAIVAGTGLVKFFAPARETSRSWALRIVALALVFGLNFRATRPALEYRVALGYPGFLRAMHWLSAHAPTDAAVLAANYPQVFWYADRRALDFPDEAGLRDALRQTEWVVLTNFERGQKAYATALTRLVTTEDTRRGDAAIFRDALFETIVVRSSVLLTRL